MLRRLIPLAVAIALVVGCKKKVDDEGGGAPGANTGGADPSKIYQVNLRWPKKGEKYEVTTKLKADVDFGAADKGGKFHADDESRYVEHVIDRPADETVPTKMTRVYAVAKRTDFETNTVKSLGVEGKAVLIEKRGSRYVATIDGKEVPDSEKLDVDDEARGPTAQAFLGLLANRRVAEIGESWSLPVRKIVDALKSQRVDVVESKSKGTCKLTRVYLQGEALRGVLEFDVYVELKPMPGADGKLDKGGYLELTGTFDSVIDASSHDVTVKATLKNNGHDPTDGGLVMTVERSIKPMK